MLYDVMNNVLGNILTMSDEFHRQHPATYQVEEVLDMEEREEMEMGD